VDGGKLSFGQITSTLMACADEGVMDQEQRYFQALQNAGEFTLDGDRLTVLYDDGQGALNFVK
jgi:heat shock protein HslJ